MPSRGRDGGGWRIRVGRRLRQLREQAGLTQVELAHASGAATSFLAGVERAERGATLDWLERVASGLGVPLERLLVGDGDRVREEIDGLLAGLPAQVQDQILRAVREVVVLLRDATLQLQSKPGRGRPA